MSLRVGIDLVSVTAVRESLAAHGRRYLERVYTEAEVADCAGADAPDPARLAARFAAKEAAIKVLRPGPDQPVPWPSIEVRRHSGGWVGLDLHGEAAALAAAAGAGDFTVSITHAGGVAAAVVVAAVDGASEQLRSPVKEPA